MFRTLSIVVASCTVVLVTSCLPALASTALPTFIEDFASSVTTVSYQQPVTFTGELVETSAKVPVPNEPVQIQFEPQGTGRFTSVATGTTGPDGRFAITTTLPSGGLARAYFGGDSGLDPSYSTPSFGLNLDANHLASRLLLDPVPSSVPAGTSVDFSGTLQVQVNGTWEPFAGQPLTLTMEPYTSSQPNQRFVTSSGADGTFSLTEPVTETSDWSVDTTTLGGYYFGDWYPDYARADYNWIDGVSKTEIVGFHVPARELVQTARSKGLYATGTVDRWNGSSWAGLAYGFVQFYYRPKGSTTWRKDGSAQTDAFGGFKALLSVRAGTTQWQGRVLPAADTLTSTSATVTSTMIDRTHMTGVQINRTSLGASVNGEVTDWQAGGTFAPMRGLKVHLYYRAQGSTTWHLYRRARLGSEGYFHFNGAKGYGYSFKVVFPAQFPFESCHSRVL